MTVDRLFADWKARALEVDILGEARARGAKLRRVGSEWVGPCPACGGKDRFGINPQKNVFICRGAAGGDVIALAQHLGGLSFTQACEQLTGEPPPRGESRPLSAEETAAREAQRAEREQESRRREAQEERRRQERAETAAEIWAACVPLDDTVSERYLIGRGIPRPPQGWPDCLRHHRGLLYDLDRTLRFNCLVARVDDVGGELTAIWRIYLSADGKKADVPSPKLGLGAAAGGAVRIGGVGPKIGVAEGLESALGAWWLTGRRFPTWATLSTSGMSGLELPIGIDRVSIFPDGDAFRLDAEGELAADPTPPGIKAARALCQRVVSMGVGCNIEAEPNAGADYLDVYNAVKEAEYVR